MPGSTAPRMGPDWLLLLALLPCIAVSLTALVVVPQFRDMYAQFGAMLPHPTRILFDTYRWLGVSCLLPLIVFWLWPSRATRGVAAFVAAALFAVALFMAGALAIYLPLMKLAQSVG